MKHFYRTILFAVCIFVCFSCGDDSKTIIPEDDIADEIVGEWVYDLPSQNAWQSMKFVAEGSYFCYSDKKEEWTEALKNIRKGNYGVKGYSVSGANGNTYLDMTVSKINGYEFTGRLNESTFDIKYNKVVMRTHLTYGQSILPPYDQLVDADIISYKSHDESLAIVDNSTGEITAVANNGRTYVDIVTKSGTAVVKVMLGKVNDGDEAELSPINKKDVTPVQPVLNFSKAIIGKWIYDQSYWESIHFLENGKLYYSTIDVERGIYNDNATGDYTIDTSTNRLTLKVLPTGGTQMTVIMAMQAISKYSFTAKFYLTDGSSTGTFTYAKQLGSIELKSGETTLPDYSSFVETGTVIKKYQSHNPNIVEVNSETGEITANNSGRTYVDVVTEDGTAVMEVNVKSFTQYNYEKLIGANKKAITDIFGFDYIADGNDIIYLSNQVENNWSQILFRFDSSTGLVIGISLLAKNDVWFTPEEMTQYLSQRFYVYEKGTEKNFKAFINAENFADATIGVTWDTTIGTLTFVQISH